MQFIILEDSITPTSPRTSNVHKRNFNNFDNIKLKEDQRKIVWNNEIYKDGENVNDVFSIFYKTLSEVADPHAPVAKITKKEQTLQL